MALARNKLNADGPDVARAAVAPERHRMGYIDGAICPAKAKGAGLVMPWATPTPRAPGRSVNMRC